jgi:hypothetical protein
VRDQSFDNQKRERSDHANRSQHETCRDDLHLGAINAEAASSLSRGARQTRDSRESVDAALALSVLCASRQPAARLGGSNGVVDGVVSFSNKWGRSEIQPQKLALFWAALLAQSDRATPKT